MFTSSSPASPWSSHGLRKIALAGALLLVVAIAAFARLYDLDGAPLADDEYYTTRSVEWIIATGLPAIPNGGYYIRGPLFQYAAATAAQLLGADAFAYRLPSALGGLLVGLLAFVYARRFTGAVGAAAVAAALLLSSWEIEFSRLIRFYTLFQCALLFFLIAIDKAYFEARPAWRYVPHSALLLAILTHELSILFLPLLFVPLIPQLTNLRFEEPPAWVRYAAISLLSALFIFGLGTYLGNLRDHGLEASLPEGYAVPPRLGGQFATPALPFFRLFPAPLAHLAAFGILAAALVLGFAARSQRRGSREAPADRLLALALLASLFHLFAAVALIFALAVARYRLWPLVTQSVARRVMLGGIFAIMAAWLLIAAWCPQMVVNEQVINRWGIADPTTSGAIARGLWSTFFGWPDFYRSTLRPFAVELPELGLALVLTMLWLVGTRFRDPLPDLLRHPGATLIYWTVIAGLFNAGSTTSRYWFPLVPVVYTFLALVLIDIARRTYPVRGAGAAAAAGSVVFLVLFALGPDFQPRHVLDPGAAAVRYRTDDFARFLETWYPRYDVRSPAATIAKWGGRAAGARVVVDTVPALSYYLDMPHAVYLDRTGARFANVARAQGALDMWSGQRLLSTPAEFVEYASGANEVWLVRSVDPESRGLDLGTLSNGAFVAVERVVPGADQRIEIVRLRPQAKAHPD